MPRLQGVVDLEIDGFQGIGRPHDRLALVLESVGDGIDLAEKVLRNVAQHLRLARQALDGLERLPRDVFRRTPHRADAGDQLLVEIGRLPLDGLAEHARMVLQRRREGVRTLRDGAVDGQRRTLDRLVEQHQALAERTVERPRPLDELGVEDLRAVGKGTVERAGILLEYGLQVLRPAVERGIEVFQIVVERVLDRLGACAQRIGQRRRVPDEHRMHFFGALTESRFQAIRAAPDRALQGGEVLSRALDDGRELDLLVRQTIDELRNFCAERAQRVRHPFGGPKKRAALSRQLLDKTADLALVLFIGTLQRRHLVMHQRFEFAGAAERARDGIVHERHLPTNRLSERCHGLLGHAVGFRQPDGDFRHGRRAQPQFFRAPRQKRQEPHHRDRDDQRGEEKKSRGFRKNGPETQTFRNLRRKDHPAEHGRDGGPHAARDHGITEGLAVGLLIQGVDQAADRGNVVVSGNLAARRSGRTAACGTARALLFGFAGRVRWQARCGRSGLRLAGLALARWQRRRQGRHR